jgi:AraC family transcriptional regulator of adaptative response / DNA-3-methyladenine glycosylase II
LRFLAGRATAGVEAVVDGSYVRTIGVGEHRGWLRVSPIAGQNALAVELATELAPALPEILARVKNLFDLGARPDVIAAHLASDCRLAGLTARSPGLRVPGAFDGFELAVRAILGQRVSVRAATTLAGRLAAAFGEPVETPLSVLERLSPTAARLAAASAAETTRLGVSAARAETIRALAQAVASRRIDLEPGLDPERVAIALQGLPGIGDWTAQYIAMRALRWPDAFPAGDLGLMKASAETSVRLLRQASEAWRPWRAYAAMYLWESLHVNTEEIHHE